MNATTMGTQPTILYAEDDGDDIELVTASFSRHPHVRLVHVPDGAAALDYLATAETLPRLILLDINMPVIDGRQTLMRLKSSETLRHIPVILFTTSNSFADKAFAQKWGAEFITKPLNERELDALADAFVEKVQT